MARMKRRLFTFASTLSLLLFLATTVVGVRSYRNNSQGDQLVFHRGGNQYKLWSQGGGVTLMRRDSVPWFFAGPSTGGKPVPMYNAESVFGLAYEFVLIPAAILPGCWWLSKHRLRRRAKRGLCLACGYDLCATPERCPECGTVPPEFSE
ncbi:MAG: hypothetical protein JWL69_1771 [Phycisphaerales bacterium]|nr:hypothetical protein [Phycisphaerales bacterium]MDB5356131.1 hypothetical protein [Phycisphaerales bacterium]